MFITLFYVLAKLNNCPEDLGSAETLSRDCLATSMILVSFLSDGLLERNQHLEGHFCPRACTRPLCPVLVPRPELCQWSILLAVKKKFLIHSIAHSTRILSEAIRHVSTKSLSDSCLSWMNGGMLTVVLCFPHLSVMVKPLSAISESWVSRSELVKNATRHGQLPVGN